jgi:uncharacterized membrane protein
VTSHASDGTESGNEPFLLGRTAHRPRHLGASLSDPPETAQRVLCAVAALGLLILAQVNFGVAVSSPWRAQISPLGFALALGLVVAACSVRSVRALNWVTLAVLLAAVALTSTEAAAYLLARHGFSTDEGAFVQYGTQLLLRGSNPFTHSMAPGLQLYGPLPVPTALANGSISTVYDYPALPLFLTVPFYWLTNGVESVSVAAVFFQCAAAAVLFVMLPERLRALAVIVVFELPLLFGFEMGGSFYTMLLPFALIAIWRWTDIGEYGYLSGGDLARAVCLGLACAVEQIVWLMALFLIVGIWRAESRRLGNIGSAGLAARFAFVTLATFGAVNLPFIAWGASAWWHGVITPFVQHAIPFGQGLVDLTLLLRAGGGNLSWYSDATLALLVALLVAYAAWFRGLWRAGVILAALVFFVSTRPLDGYWLEIAPLWTAAVAVPGPVPDPLPLVSSLKRLASLRVVLTTALFAPSLAFLGLALSATAPLQLRIESVQVVSAQQGVWSVSVRVTNRTGNPIRPHFADNSGGQLSAYWDVDSGPAVLPGGQTALYVVSSPDPGTNPGILTPFVMSAVSPCPEAISTSQVFQVVNRFLVLTPRQVDVPVPSGHTVVFRAQVENANGIPRPIAGIQVTLKQTALTKHGRQRPRASINGQPLAKRVVTALTNRRGIATFRVRGFVAATTGGAPIYFRSWISAKHSFPYGYSNIVEVTWSSPTPKATS